MDITPREVLINGTVDLVYLLADRATVVFPDSVVRADGVEVAFTPVASQDGQRITVSAAFVYLQTITSPVPSTGEVVFKFGANFVDPASARDPQPVVGPDGSFTEFVTSASIDWGDGTVETLTPPLGFSANHVYAASGDYLVRFIVALRADRAPLAGPTQMECRKTLHITV